MDEAETGTIASARKRRRFFTILALIALAALALRVTYILTVTQHDTDVYDATYYELEALTITNGPGFFIDPFPLLRPGGKVEQSADHPPLTVLSLLPAALIQGSDASPRALPMRFTMTLFGVGSVLLIGLLARRIGGDTVGLVAAGIAAFDPNLWMNDGLVMSESLAVLLTVALMYGSYQVLQRGTTWKWTIGLGALSGLLILTRAELGILLPFLVLPALWVGSRRAPSTQAAGARGMERAKPLVGACVVAGLLVAPWVGFNLARFQEPTLLSTSDGVVLRAANCPDTYDGPLLGFANIFPLCTLDRGKLEQSVWNAKNRTLALDYMGDHIGRLPVVALARLGRSWSLYKLGQTADLTAHEGRPTWASYLGAVVTWIMIALAIAGAIVLRRRRTAIWPLVVPIVMTSVSIALLSGGLLRYRAPAEPSLIVLGAVAIVAFVSRRTAGDAPAGDVSDAGAEALVS